MGEKQRSTEQDLSKAEPMVEAAMAALNTLDKKDLGEIFWETWILILWPVYTTCLIFYSVLFGGKISDRN